MELFLACCAITGLATIIAAVDESIYWMQDYYRAGEEDREYQRQRQQQKHHE